MKKKKELKPVKLILAELDASGYHLFLTAKVNGKRCRFLLDTGASKSVVDKSFFEKHFGAKKLKSVKQDTTGLHSTVYESHFGTVDTLEFDKLLVKKYVLAAIDLSHVNMTYAKLKKPKIQGILGSDLLVKHKAVIDYGNAEIRFET
jgi:hypothetical protein